MTKPQKPNSSADKVREAQSSILTEPNAMTPDDVELSKNKQSPDSGLDVGKKSAQSPKALDKPMVEKIVKPAKKPDSSAVKKKGNRSSSMTAKDSNTSAARKTTDNTLDSKNMNSGCDDLSHADLLQQIKNLKAKCSKDETTIASQNLMMKELTTLNMELQRDVIQYFKEFKVMSEQYDGVIRNLEGCNAPPPGHISNDKIHLGHNVWIPYSTYNGAVNRAKSNQMFVKEIAVAVFGYDVLKNSSITGTQSNKFKDKPAKAKLDETKMLAISDIYRHRLLAIQKASEFNTQMELSKVNLYVTRKISDLNKLKKTDKPSTSSMTSSVPEEDDQKSDAGDDIGTNSNITDDVGNSPIRILEDHDNKEENTGLSVYNVRLTYVNFVGNENRATYEDFCFSTYLLDAEHTPNEELSE